MIPDRRFPLFQGLCGAALIPMSQAVLLDINAPKDHPRAMAIWIMGANIDDRTLESLVRHGRHGDQQLAGQILGRVLCISHSCRSVFLKARDVVADLTVSTGLTKV